MKKQTKSKPKKEECKCKKISCGCTEKTGFFYFLGFLGAAVYFISTATGFWVGVLGVIKAIFWPAFLIYGLLKFLGL